jgi:uncharacterized membrane protein YfhO
VERPVHSEGLATPPSSNGLRARLLGVAACAAALLVCEVLVFRYLFKYGVSNIWYADGASQHLPALMYVREWMTAILSGHGSGFGAWSWRLGFGADTMTTLSYYIADPFALLAVLFPAHALELVYEGLFFLRILCAGLAGFVYLRTVKATRFAAIAGACAYVFASYLMQVGLKHPYFVNPMVWFPLVLAGTELVLARRRWYLLVAALLMAAVCNYYFFYQIGIVAVLYAVARWLEVTERGQRLRRLARDGLPVAGWYALGTLAAAFSLVPVALAVQASSRITAHTAIPVLFTASEYLREVLALASPVAGNNESLLMGGFAMAGLLAAGLVFLRRGNLALKIMLSAFALFALSPLFGALFNGSSSASYRFYFMAGLFVAAAFAALLSDPQPPARRELTWLAAGLAAYGAVYLYAARNVSYPLWLVLTPLAIGAATLGLFALERCLLARPAPTWRTRTPVLRGAVFVLMLAGIAAAATASYSSRYDPILTTYLRSGTAVQLYEDDPGSLVRTLPSTGLQRTDKQQGVLLSDLDVSSSNDPLAQGYSGLDFYYSIMNGGVHEYLMDLLDRTSRFSYDFEGLDDRAVLDTLNGVRYYIAPAGGEVYVPYGFVRDSTLGTETVYENRFTLPVGYVYHSVISSGTFAAMPPLDRQQSLLQGVVLGDEQAASLPRIVPASETREVTYTLTPEAGLRWNEVTRRVTIRRQGAGADLTFAAVPGAELYVQLSGVTFSNLQRGSIDSRLMVVVSATGPRKAHRFLPASSAYSWGDDALLVNLGYLAHGTTHARISFLDRKAMRYASLKVLAVPMTGYATRVDRLAAEGMRDVRVGTDSLSGTVTSRGDGLLFLSIPYSPGWSATVDGRPAQIMHANVGFSGIAVTSGSHHVELRYATPGLRTGIAISLMALLLALGLAVVTERRITASRRLPRDEAAEKH